MKFSKIVFCTKQQFTEFVMAAQETCKSLSAAARCMRAEDSDDPCAQPRDTEGGNDEFILLVTVGPVIAPSHFTSASFYRGSMVVGSITYIYSKFIVFDCVTGTSLPIKM